VPGWVIGSICVGLNSRVPCWVIRYLSLSLGLSSQRLVYVLDARKGQIWNFTLGIQSLLRGDISTLGRLNIFILHRLSLLDTSGIQPLLEILLTDSLGCFPAAGLQTSSLQRMLISVFYLFHLRASNVLISLNIFILWAFYPRRLPFSPRCLPRIL
jgi:hypothetical protein